MRDLNKFKGCLIGGAVGDALGYTVEFLPANHIFEKYGERGITEHEIRNGVAEISDDTQMTLFTATGLLLGTTRGMTRGIMGDYAEWLHSAQLPRLVQDTDRKISLIRRLSLLLAGKYPADVQSQSARKYLLISGGIWLQRDDRESHK